MSSEDEKLETPVWLGAVFDEFEKLGYFEDFSVAGRISAAMTDAEPIPDLGKKAANAELWAFQFLRQSPGTQSCWKTHFGPSMEFGETKIPDIAWIDPAIIAYWTARAATAKHPLLRGRYADLVWDLAKSAKAKVPVDAARTVVDSYNACAPMADQDSVIPISDMLRRALEVALGIKDQARVDRTRDAIFDVLSRADDAWGWVTLYRIAESQKKVRFSEPQAGAMIAGLEACVAAISSKPEGEEPATAFHVAGLLARHYQRSSRQSDSERVILACGQAAERKAASASNSLAHLWLDHIFRVYRLNGLEAEAARIQLLARERGEKAQEEMPRVEASFEIPKDELEAFVDGITEGGLNEAIGNIVGRFIPDIDDVRRRAGEDRKKFPIATMATIAKIGEGQVVGNVGPIESDPEGALLHGVSEEITCTAIFLAKSFDRAWERYATTPDEIVSFLFDSPVFTVRFRGIIALGIKAYFEGDHPKAIHLLVPQIENALRFFLQLLGIAPNKARRGEASSMTEKTLTDILEHEPVIKQKLGEAAHIYLLAFLADSRGKNLRNRMSHGLMAADEFNRAVSDRVLHILLMLGTIRERTEVDLPQAVQGAGEPTEPEPSA